MSIEVEETIKRIQSHKGVKGVLIMNTEGIPIRSNFSPEDTENYASLVSQVVNSIIPTFLLTCFQSWLSRPLA